MVAPGLEQLAAEELADLGAGPLKSEQGGVGFRTDPGGLVRVNAAARIISRVLVRVARFRAAAFHELEQGAGRIPWEVYLPRGGVVRFRVTAHRSRLYHSRAVAQRLARAAEQRVGATTIHRDEIDEDRDGQSGQLFVVRLDQDQCTISADSSGDLLHRRGYRLAGAKAPLRETLAAAMLRAVRWNGEVPLLDPFCGSGTIPIEAALLAMRIAPNLDRARRGELACLHWPAFHGEWAAPVLDELEARALRSCPVPIHGSDRDAGAIAAARSNLARAGINGVEFEVRSVSAVAPGGVPGWVVTNPPFGVRIGDRNRLRRLYAQLGEVMRGSLAGWKLAMLETHVAMRRATGVSLSERFSTTTGGIRVRLVATPEG